MSEKLLFQVQAFNFEWLALSFLLGKNGMFWYLMELDIV